jgi:hypothetical protein
MMISKIISLVCVLTFVGCDIFSTRTPESPSEQSSNFIQPTTPDIVVTNFQNSIEGSNVDDYIKCFVDTLFSDKKFEFGPSLETGIDRALFLGWNLESERQYLLNLGKPSFGSPGLMLSNKHIINVTSDSVVYNFDYSLFYPSNDQSFPTSFGGNLQFYIVLDQKHNWSIYKWLDFKTTSPYTWSYLKAVKIGG